MNTIPEKLPDDMAIWRFGVISPLLHRHPEGNSLSEELQCIAAKTFLLPNGQQRRFSSDTLRHWLYRYRKDGLAGLKDKVPKNHGRTFISLAMQDAIAKYRKQHPRWTTKGL
jgi:putative transposase